MLGLKFPNAFMCGVKEEGMVAVSLAVAGTESVPTFFFYYQRLRSDSQKYKMGDSFLGSRFVSWSQKVTVGSQHLRGQGL